MTPPLNHKKNTFSCLGNLCDWQKKLIYPAEVQIFEGKIQRIQKMAEFQKENLPFILPGFTDAHVHIESSLLIPSEFARMATIHGTIGTVSDPHEIANVCGAAGIHYMLNNAATVPFRFHFGVPSCVPATSFETAGAVLDAAAVTTLLHHPRLNYLAEMMNYPGVWHRDPEVMQKIAAAHALGKPVDGHAPGLRGEALQQYIEAGISTDHECVSLEEALEKVASGMKILIRQGSAARNFDALIPLMGTHPEMLMFCSDDKHPDSLLEGHINQLYNKAIQLGYNFWDVMYAACVHPVLHYQTAAGLLREGDPADFILTDSIEEIIHPTVYIHGEMVASAGKTHILSTAAETINHFVSSACVASDFNVPRHYDNRPAIAVYDGQLITGKHYPKYIYHPYGIAADPEQDIIYMAVVNRYRKAAPAVAMVHGTGIRQGAMASSVAHDSHNIVVCGTDPGAMARAVNLIMEARGGLALVCGEQERLLDLPVAGLMTHRDGFETARQYIQIDALAKTLTGTPLRAPFMTLSFLALPVIPHLKLSDLGLFDVDAFDFC